MSFFCFVFQTISTGLYLKRFRFLNYFSTLLLAYIHTAVYNPGVYDFNLYMHDPEWIILISKLLFFYTVASNPAAQTFTSNIKLLMQLQRLLHSARIKTKLCFSNFMTVGPFCVSWSCPCIRQVLLVLKLYFSWIACFHCAVLVRNVGVPSLESLVSYCVSVVPSTDTGVRFTVYKVFKGLQWQREYLHTLTGC